MTIIESGLRRSTKLRQCYWCDQSIKRRENCKVVYQNSLHFFVHPECAEAFRKEELQTQGHIELPFEKRLRGKTIEESEAKE